MTAGLPQLIPQLILASQSPRRRQLLAEAGYSFRVVTPRDAEEPQPKPGESTDEYVKQLAVRKANDVVGQGERGLILACDTVAECDGRILGKPCDRDDARRMLETLRGRAHQVYSGLCLLRTAGGKPRVRAAVTRLRMDQLTDDQLEEYLASGAWQGKAGAFGYQDRLGWVHVVEGSESNVVGLPLELLAEMLSSEEAC